VAADTGTPVVQSMIGHGFLRTDASELVVRLILYASFEPRIANDLDKGVHATLAPSAQQLISLKSVGQTPDDFFR
jgi:hypothetical protein